MSLLERLSDEAAWLEFREYKSHHSHMSNREFEVLDKFIESKEYLKVTGKLSEPNHGFSYPSRRVINKSGTKKKRVVYTFPDAETWVLKLLTWLLYRYDDKLCDNCFSFRRNVTVKDAIEKVLTIPNLGDCYALKADIHNYFNSMPTEGMVKAIRDVITDDEPLVYFLTDILSVNRAVVNGEVVAQERGAMAGVPISAFMANIYLLPLDREFERMGVPYFRYSDDIIVFTESEKERDDCFKIINEWIVKLGLEINPDKVMFTNPRESWEFLGFSYQDGKIDLSDVTIAKIKAKIRRKCRALYRWRLKKGVDFDHAAAVVIRVFNRKFYDLDEEYDFTWSRWFFPVLTSDAGLHEIDEYFVSELRYIYSGRHYKGNYAITYEHLKNLGYLSLVNEYYKFKNR